MATQAETSAPAAPRRRWALGCGVVLMLLLAALMLLLVSSTRKAGRLISTGQSFLQEAAGGSLDNAWAMVLPARQEALGRERFDAEWQAVRGGLGALQEVRVQGLDGYDTATSSMTYRYQLRGSNGSAQGTVRLNPNDAPLRVLGYRVSGLDSRGAAAQKGDSPAK